MKKYSLFFVIYLVLSSSLFGQYFDYISLGYNTVKTTTMSGGKIDMFHYFLNDPNYSKLRINTSYNLLQTERIHQIQQGNNFYDGIIVGSFLHDGDFFYYKEKEGYNFNRRTEIYRLTNGRLTHVQWGDYTSNRIVYTSTGITVTMRGRNRSDQFMIEFSNIPDAQIRSMFMDYLWQTIDTTIGTSYQPDDVIIESVTKSLKRITKTELKLFWNILLNRHGNSTMPNMISSLNNRELMLLEIIQKELADKYFMAGGYYKIKHHTSIHKHPYSESEIISVIDEGEWVQVIEEGESSSRNGITSVWLKLKLEDNTEGWIFGGFVSY